MKSAEPFHVGEFLAEAMKARGMDPVQLAVAMGGAVDVNLLTVELILHDRTKGVTLAQETAEEFARIFETSSELWMNLDRSWQEHEIT